MNSRWSVSFDDGATWVLTKPDNAGKLKTPMKRDLGKGQIFFRKALSGAIIWGKDDFTQFIQQERQSTRRCNTILVRYEIQCALAWQEDWRGKFSTGAGKFDLFECTFEVKPDTVDKYTCILDNQDVKANLLLSDVHDVTAVTTSMVFFGMSVYDAFDPGGPIYRTYNVPLDTDGNSTDPTWGLQGYTYTVTGPGAIVWTYKLWWSEQVFTDCIDGSPQPPGGAGWSLIVDFCASSGIYAGKALWGRIPPFPFTVAGNSHAGTYDPITLEAIPPDLPCNGNWLLAQPTDFALQSYPALAPGAHRLPIYICFTGTVVASYTRAHTLADSLDQILIKADCGSTCVHSDFFAIDPLGDAPGYVSGMNYVTGLPTQVDNIMLVQKTDAITPDASQHATIGEMTFKDMMKAINAMFRVYWDIDTNGCLRLEHWSYWIFPIGIDLRSAPNAIEPLVYSHLSEDTPHLESLSFEEVIGKDFRGVDIVYGGPCVNKALSVSIQPGKITTDILAVGLSSKDGFLMMACVPDGSGYSTILDVGALSGASVTNAPLSTANLQRDYWTWDRYLPNGNMNGVDTVFDGFLPNIEQTEVSYSACCDELTFVATDRITTALGHAIGDVKAMVWQAEFDTLTGRTKLTLRYSY